MRWIVLSILLNLLCVHTIYLFSIEAIVTFLVILKNYVAVNLVRGIWSSHNGVNVFLMSWLSSFLFVNVITIFIKGLFLSHVMCLPNYLISIERILHFHSFRYVSKRTVFLAWHGLIAHSKSSLGVVETPIKISITSILLRRGNTCSRRNVLNRYIVMSFSACHLVYIPSWGINVLLTWDQ